VGVAGSDGTVNIKGGTTTIAALSFCEVDVNFAMRQQERPYHSLSKIHPWVMNLSDCSKRGVGIFLRTFSLKNRPTQVLKIQICTSKIAAKQYSKNSNLYK